MGDPSRLSGSESSFRIFALFPIFFVYRHFRIVSIYATCGNLRSSHPNCLYQCGISTPYPYLAYGNPKLSHCTLLLGCDVSCRNFWIGSFCLLSSSFSLIIWEEILVSVLDCFMSIRLVVDRFLGIGSPSLSFYKFLLFEFCQQGYNL
jgi:hypothetical protein